jgi:predicted peptidase
MRKLVIFLCILSFVSEAFSQTQLMYRSNRKVAFLPSNAGTFQGVTINSIGMGYLEYMPATTPAPGRKFPVFIYFHGIGERGGRATAKTGQPLASRYWDTTDNLQTGDTSIRTGEIGTTLIGSVDRLYWLQPFNGLKTTSGSLVGKRWAKPKGSTNDSTEFIFLAPQCWGKSNFGTGNFGFAWWPKAYLKRILEVARSMPDADTNRIYVGGTSFGGGAVGQIVADSTLNSWVAAAVLSCMGYRDRDDTGDVSQTYNYAMVARSGLPTWFLHQTDDDAAAISIADG